MSNDMKGINFAGFRNPTLSDFKNVADALGDDSYIKIGSRTFHVTNASGIFDRDVTIEATHKALTRAIKGELECLRTSRSIILTDEDIANFVKQIYDGVDTRKPLSTRDIKRVKEKLDVAIEVFKFNCADRRCVCDKESEKAFKDAFPNQDEDDALCNQIKNDVFREFFDTACFNNHFGTACFKPKTTSETKPETTSETKPETTSETKPETTSVKISGIDISKVLDKTIKIGLEKLRARKLVIDTLRDFSKKCGIEMTDVALRDCKCVVEVYDWINEQENLSDQTVKDYLDKDYLKHFTSLLNHISLLAMSDERKKNLEKKAFYLFKGYKDFSANDINSVYASLFSGDGGLNQFMDEANNARDVKSYYRAICKIFKAIDNVIKKDITMQDVFVRVGEKGVEEPVDVLEMSKDDVKKQLQKGTLLLKDYSGKREIRLDFLTTLFASCCQNAYLNSIQADITFNDEDCVLDVKYFEDIGIDWCNDPLRVQSDINFAHTAVPN